MFFENRHLTHSGCLHALCESERIAFRDFGLRNPICVIPNGIDLPVETQGLNAPWENAIASDKKVLLFLARIHPQKGLFALLDAWRLVQKDNVVSSEWVLAIAGWDQGGHETELKQYVHEHSLEESVIFLGPLFSEAKQAALSNADAFILPSHSEGLPMTVLEAWANSLPVLMTPACNLPIGFDCGAALCILPESYDICKGLLALFAMTNEQRKSMGGYGRNLVAERFAWDKVAGQFHEVYTWILGGGTPPSFVEL